MGGVVEVAGIWDVEGVLSPEGSPKLDLENKLVPFEEANGFFGSCVNGFDFVNEGAAAAAAAGWIDGLLLIWNGFANGLSFGVVFVEGPDGKPRESVRTVKSADLVVVSGMNRESSASASASIPVASDSTIRPFTCASDTDKP
jgi:hypothetical protein